METADHQSKLTCTELGMYFPPCPYLPPPSDHMDYRSLRSLKGRDGDLFPVALTYGHYLWQKGLPARAILALARGIYCDLDGSEPVLDTHPLPYLPLRWIIQNYNEQSGRFMGNPRLSFQHQALRLRGPRREQRSWRAWAVNCIARQARPTLQPDPCIHLPEPTAGEIADALTHHGIPNETSMFTAALQDIPRPAPQIEPLPETDFP